MSDAGKMRKYNNTKERVRQVTDRPMPPIRDCARCAGTGRDAIGLACVGCSGVGSILVRRFEVQFPSSKGKRGPAYKPDPAN